MVSPWGTAFPRWTWWLAGRRVPRFLPLTPVWLIAPTLALYGTGSLIYASFTAYGLVGLGGAASLAFGGYGWALCVAAVSYQIRTRPRCTSGSGSVYVENWPAAPSRVPMPPPWPHDPREISMAIQRMDNVLIVVEDLDAVISFFVELGMELEGKGPIEAEWADRVIAIDGARQDVAMLRTPDGSGRIELTRFHTPKAVRSEPTDAPVNTLGIRRVMFAVDDIEDTVARVRAKGAELVGEIVRYEDVYRLCYVRGPEGIVVGLAEQLT